jgi:hypothetical protein
MARPNPRRNITRIVQTTGPAGRVCTGWEVRIQRRGRRIEKFFADRAFGGNRKALRAAKRFRDGMESQMRPYLVRELARTPSTRNTSGLVGIRRAKKIDLRSDPPYSYWCWVAQWTDGRGRRRTRSFSVRQYGDETARARAIEARQRGISQSRR